MRIKSAKKSDITFTARVTQEWMRDNAIAFFLQFALANVMDGYPKKNGATFWGSKVKFEAWATTYKLVVDVIDDENGRTTYAEGFLKESDSFPNEDLQNFFALEFQLEPHVLVDILDAENEFDVDDVDPKVKLWALSCMTSEAMLAWVMKVNQRFQALSEEIERQKRGEEDAYTQRVLVRLEKEARRIGHTVVKIKE